MTTSAEVVSVPEALESPGFEASAPPAAPEPEACPAPPAAPPSEGAVPVGFAVPPAESPDPDPSPPPLWLLGQPAAKLRAPKIKIR